MVNVNGRETGLREPRRAYGGVVDVRVVLHRVAYCAVLIKQSFSDSNLKGGRLADRGW